ncbi:site-specific integrase [Cryobacterium sp.]|uniref:tyrosine-type recombinase/integrase n=1 Tax=Cryobacterium sp. TaxID=1926290 RepID=UPI0026252E51|nr:site-specific integrase [Cryobacterium sp.]MCU1445037.1 Integrase [Cryobacterium sp.]
MTDIPANEPMGSDSAQHKANKTRRSRSRHAGSLADYATKAGQRWKFQIYALKDPEKPELGETRITRGGFKSLEAAQSGLAEALKRKVQNEKFQGKVPTITEYANHWVTGLRLQNSTIQGYRKIIRNHISPAIGNIRLDKLTATRIAAHYRELEKSGRRDTTGLGEPLSANSVNKVHVVLGALLDAAVDDGLIAMNPAKKKRTVNAPTGSQIRAQRPEIKTWTGGELHAFLTWNRDVLRDDLFPLWRTIAYTGMRRSEALALRWSDLNTATGRLSIRRAADVTVRNLTKSTKTGSARVLDLDPETVGILKAFKAQRGAISLDLARADAYVFGNDAGAIRSPNEVGRRWTFRVERAQAAIDGLPRVTLKGLRHTHATLLLELGEHPKVVQERLGHSTITTTMNIYSHVTPTMQKAAVNRFAEHLDRLSTYFST